MADPLQNPQQTVADLGQLVKTKYPGAYDQMDDAEVGRRVKLKYPVYSQFADMPAAPALPQKPSDGLPQPDQAVEHATDLGRVIGDLATRPAPPPAAPAPSFLDRAKNLFHEGAAVATTHAVKALGGLTATELWENAGHAAKGLIEHTLGEPWDATRANLPAPAKTAEFLYHASKVIPGILDFLFTPAGAATAALPGAPAAVQAGAGAYFGTEMAKGTGEAYKRFKQAPSPSTAGELAGNAVATLLPAVHAAGAEYNNQLRAAYMERAKAPEQQYTSTGQPVRIEGSHVPEQVKAEPQGAPAPAGPEGQPARPAEPGQQPAPVAPIAAAAAAPAEVAPPTLEAPQPKPVEPVQPVSTHIEPDPVPEAVPERVAAHRAPAPVKPREPATEPEYGRAVNVAIPGEEAVKYPARYAIREAADVQPSHNAFSFEPNPAYEHQNDRDYKGNKEISSLVVERSGPKFDPVFTTMESATAEHGAPVIDARGNVLGGNSRSMTLGRVYESNPAGAEAYKAALRDRAASYGLTPYDFDRFQKPVLVRELTGDFDPQNAITDFNKKGAAELKPGERAVSDGRRLSDNTVQLIAAKIENVGEDSTLAQAIQGENGAEIVDSLIKDGVISPQERGALLETREEGDVLTPEGKDRIAKMLVGRMFGTPAEFNSTPPELRNKLERIAPQVLRLEGRPEWGITPQIREALGILAEAREHGIRNVADLVGQDRLGGERKEYPPEAVAIARTLGNGPLAAARAFRQYANDEMLSREGAQGAFFTPPTRQEAFEEAFPSKSGQRGSASLELLSLGADQFWRDDVAPALHAAAETFVGGADDVLKVLAPQLRSESAHQAGLILRNRLAEMARRYDQAQDSLRQAKRAFDRMDPAQGYEFIRRMEAGEKQQAPELDAVAKTLRAMLDGRRADVQALGTGKLQSFYENYFPHIWTKAKKASDVFRSFFGRSPLEGGKSFLKQRTLPTFEDGIKAGLKPVSDNPIELVMLKTREMDRYLMAHQVLAEWKKQGLAKFVDAREGKAPAGWRKIQDSIATVYGQSIQNISEFPNAGLWSGLKAVAGALGLKHERGFKSLHGAVGNASKGSGVIRTLHGSAEDVLAHEIGHQIDWLAGSGKRFVLEYPDPGTVARLKRAYATVKDLQGTTLEQRRAAREELQSLKGAIAQRKEFQKQLRDLADLRGGEKSYTRKREEKMAQLAEMWVGARPLFERTAPKVYQEWKNFLDENPKLHALRDIEGNTEVDAIAQPYDVGGLVIKGNYYAPEGAARILDNYLTPGLRSKSGAYRVLLGANNVLNQAQLGLSAFHLGFTSADAAVSKGALAIEQLVRGHGIEALKSAFQVPIAPFSNAIQGNKLLREWYKPGSEGGQIAAMVDALEKAGGRVRMDEMYQTRVAEKMGQAFRHGNLLGGLLRAPFAGVEALGNIIMKQIVPRQKLGVFADLARLEMERLGPGATVEQTRDVMAKAWDSVENRMGQMTYDNLFWDRTAKDLSMLAVRSVGWNLGTIREIGGAGIDAVKIPIQTARGKSFDSANIHRLAYVASLAITSAAMGALYQYLSTGKGPEETKDYFFPKTGETDEGGRPQRMSMPTYVKDVYHYATEPGRTLANKTSPLVSLVAEMVRNQDFYGTRIRNEDDPLIRQMLDAGKHVAASAEPFGFRNLERERKLQAPAAQKVEQFFGITPAPPALEKTKAELLASELAHAGVPGGRTEEQAARSEELRTIRRLAATGKPAGAEISKALRAGTLTVAQIREALAQARMDPLARTFHGLTLEAALKVWKAATPHEKAKLRPFLAKKGQSLASKPPAERAVLLPQFVRALQGK